MSTRWYPLYQTGGPQLRVFLPNFWMKLVRPTHDQPQNVVQFSCSMEMTTPDIKNYLEKIYNVKTIDIRTRIALGKTKKQPGKGYIIKDDDIKYAYVTLHSSQKFDFPDLFPERKEDEADKRTMDEIKDGFKKYLETTKNRPNLPGWFSI
ncbi:hypothetical protein WA026_009561 [Henosepilachna vigintioctopunctata]|uniref:Large ribosomal subunit protein uL23m n=1 Tax=Henosepilachna vigintioctopunctata TaxID=420089 RepID=A0AAW1TZQ8_9CUCU